MPDVRTRRTDAAIKSAFLDLLSEKPLASITMSELSFRSGVSRSTLYVHFNNVNEVFEALTQDFFANVRGLRAALRCEECGEEGQKQPFCMALRAAGPYQPLVMAPEFLPTYLRCMLDGPHEDDILEPYRDVAATESQARALLTFQMTGCYAAATMGHDVIWSESQCAIDQFIRGGFAALRALPKQSGQR